MSNLYSVKVAAILTAPMVFLSFASQKENMNDPNFGEQLESDETAPVLGSWDNLYVFVIVMHFILIALFYWFTKTYS